MTGPRSRRASRAEPAHGGHMPPTAQRQRSLPLRWVVRLAAVGALLTLVIGVPWGYRSPVPRSKGSKRYGSGTFQIPPSLLSCNALPGWPGRRSRWPSSLTWSPS